MDYQIQVYKDGEWKDLLLYDETIVKYNVISNKIGEPSKREISHSNTYTLPNVGVNTNILGLNKFNYAQLTKALNTKVDCRIKNKGKITKEAFLVINNMTRKDIKINVIDKALDLLDKWGSVSLYEMLSDSALFDNLPAATKTAVNAMINYEIKNTGLTVLPNIAGKNYPYALFPNTLNAIGDDFNELANDGGRIPVDRLNTYQTRPLFNSKAFIESICQAYNYSPIFGSKVDLVQLEETYIVPSGGSEGETFEKTDYPAINSFSTPEDHYRPGSTIELQQHFRLSPEAYTYKPTDFGVSWVDPVGILPQSATSAYTIREWREQQCIYSMASEISPNYTGKLALSADIVVGVGQSPASRFVVKAVYSEFGNTGITFEDVEIEGSDQLDDWKSIDDRPKLDAIIDKSKIAKKTTGSNMIVGIMVIGIFRRGNPNGYEPYHTPYMTNMQLVDEWAGDKLVYNQNKEYYIGNYPNLLRNAPEEPVKKLFSGLLNQQGLLCNINDKSKTVTIFNYEDIKTKILARDHDDWSKYFIRWMNEDTDTAFGDKYAIKNRISLNEPYRGNHNDYKLADQGEDSKYKDFIESKVETYKDISDIKLVNLGGNKPYYEYKNEGLGLVSSNSKINGLIQIRADGSEHGTIDAPHVQNVNYANLPIGVRSWYEIINSGLRINGFFLLPEEVALNFDITRPVYVGDIRASLIVEEIKEYVDSRTPVEVKFILPGLYSPLYE